MKEYGIECDLVVKSDAVAAIGIVKRQGLGRVRHLAVADLWVQQRAKGGEVSYVKLDGKKNTSDMMSRIIVVLLIFLFCALFRFKRRFWNSLLESFSPRTIKITFRKK